MEASGTAHVEEGLVERDRFHERRHRPEQLHHPLADLAVVGVISGQEDGVGTESTGPSGGHGRVDPIGPGLIGRSGHHPAVSGTSHHHGLSHQLGSAPQLDSSEEGIHVDVEDVGSGLRFPGARSVAHGTVDTRNDAGSVPSTW